MMLRQIKPRCRRSYLEDLHGWLITVLPQSQSPGLKRPQLRRERRYQRERRKTDAVKDRTNLVENSGARAGAAIQKVRALAALPEDSGLI